MVHNNTLLSTRGAISYTAQGIGNNNNRDRQGASYLRLTSTIARRNWNSFSRIYCCCSPTYRMPVIIQSVQYLVHLTVPIESCFGLKSWVLQSITVAMVTSKEWEICQVLDEAKSTWWAFLTLFQELNVAMVIKEFNIIILKSPLNQERYKILLMIYFLIYRNLLEFITFVQSYFHYL